MPASIHISSFEDEVRNSSFGSARSWIAYGAELKREAILMADQAALRMPIGRVEIARSVDHTALESVRFLPLLGEHLPDS
jgi:hypothetical protein